MFDATADTFKGQEYNIIRSGVKDMMLSKFNAGKKVERVCVCERERESESARERKCVCVCERERERERK